MTDTVEQRRTEPHAAAAPWLRLARIGAVAVATWAATLQILAGHVILPIAIVGAGFALMALLVRRATKREGLVVASVAAVALVGNAPAVIEQFSRPESGLEFILNTIVTSSVLLVVAAGVAAFREWPTHRIRPISTGWTGAVLAGGVIALVASASVESAAPASNDIQIAAQGVAFDRATMTAAAGRVGFWVDNQDPFHHTFTIRGTGQEIDLPASSAQRGEFELEAGVYEVFCDIPGHENMAIELIVEG